MGRTPQPTNIRALKGRSPGKDSGGRPLKRQPTAVAATPDRPGWLAPEAAEMWERVTPELERLGILARIDLGALTAYCEAWSTWKAAALEVDRGGVTVYGRDGSRVRNPALLAMQSASAELRAWAVQLGLSPAARLRMTLPEGDDEEETAAVFGRVGRL